MTPGGPGAVPSWQAMTTAALLYAAPLSTAALESGRWDPARVALAMAVRLAQPGGPAPDVLATGLAHARAGRPGWLDTARLAVCDRLGAEVTDTPEATAPAGPGWRTTPALLAGYARTVPVAPGA